MEIADLENVQKIIGDLEKKYHGGNFIFRGATEEYSADPDGDGVNCTLYRWAVKELGGKLVFDSESFTLAHFEKEQIEKAKRLLSQNTDKRELLTSLQHYGGKTTLIDFTRSLHVALFFACNDYSDKDEDVKDGELIIMRADILPNFDEIEHPGREQIAPFVQVLTRSVSQDSIALIEPAKTDDNKQRVLTQHSVFVRAVSGYLKKDATAEGGNIAKGKYAVEKIAKKDKEAIMTYLADYYDVDYENIYNDLAGFTANTSNYESFEFCMRMGRSHNETHEYKNALMYFHKALRHTSSPVQRSIVYNSIGSVFFNGLKNNKEAFKNFTKSMQLNPTFYMPHYNRGNVLCAMGNLPAGINHFNVALALAKKDNAHPNVILMISLSLDQAKKLMEGAEAPKSDDGN